MGYLKTFVIPHNALDVLLQHPKPFVEGILYNADWHTQFRFRGFQITSFPFRHADEEHVMVWHHGCAKYLHMEDSSNPRSDREKRADYHLCLLRNEVIPVTRFVAEELRFLRDFQMRKVAQPNLSKVCQQEPFESLHSFVTIYGDRSSDIEREPVNFVRSLAETIRAKYANPLYEESAFVQTMVQVPVGKNPAIYVHSGNSVIQYGRTAPKMKELRDEFPDVFADDIKLIQREYDRLGTSSR